MYDVGRNFSMNRVLHDYLYRFYLKGHSGYKQLCENEFNKVSEIQNVQNILQQNWKDVAFKKVEMNIYPDEQIPSGYELNVRAEINLNEIPENLIKVEVFYKKDNWEFIPLISKGDSIFPGFLLQGI